VAATPVAVFVAVTSTPGIIAPEESDTVPPSVALTPTWPNPLPVKSRQMARAILMHGPFKIVLLFTSKGGSNDREINFESH
jgi:hypothetical protein